MHKSTAMAGQIEIVAAKINGSTISNSLPEIVKAAKSGMLNEIYNRKQIKFMAACDLGRNWDLIANGPALLLIADDGSVTANAKLTCPPITELKRSQEL